MSPLGKFTSLTLPAEPRTRVHLWLGSRNYWLFQIGLWLVFVAGLDVVSAAVANEVVTGFNVVSALAFGAEMIAGTHVARALLLLLRRRPRSAFALVLTTALGVLLCGAVTMAIGLALSYAFGHLGDASTTALLRYAYAFAYNGSTHGAFWLAAYTGSMFLRGLHAAEIANLRAAAAAQEAELIAIRAQINPHFLFNSLNTLRALIPREQKEPREAISRLSDLLRSALTVTASETIPLRRELETVDAYLALERLRFEERLRVRREVEPALLDCRIPPFALQTLVENAVKFGVGTRPEGGEIRITAAARQGRIDLRVSNPGRIAVDSGSTGIGLRNAINRLGHLYGADAHLTLTQSEPETVTAELSLPAAA
ncbi:MAG TPA: histidine kinase [Opitutaceae bacterium]|nr:histidine kinase [Opitutaceae bacterium]